MDTPCNTLASTKKGMDLEDALQTQPKYSRLRSYLRAELNANRLKPGEPLPTEMKLAKTLQIARGTVRQAMAELERDGLIYRIRGKGTFVREQPNVVANVGVSDFALLVPETRYQYSSLLHGFEVAASEVSSQVTICSTDNDIHKQGNLILQLLRKKVAGVAIVPATSPPTPPYQIHELQERGIPVVLCHRRIEGVKAPFLSIPFNQIGRMAGEAFIRHGHRRVACFSALLSEATTSYEEGMREALRSGGRNLSAEFVYIGKATSTDIIQQKEVVSQTLRRMFDDPDPPTAIFASGDAMAEMLYLLLGRMDMRVPENVSLISFGDAHRQGALLSRITAIVLDESDLGHRAVDLLNQMGTGKRPITDESKIVMPINISDGGSLGPASHEKTFL